MTRFRTLFAAALLLLAWTLPLGDAEPPQPAAAAAIVPAVALPAVTVVEARRGVIAETEVITGTLAPREEILVSPLLDGLAVTEVLVEAGDTVRAGQALARLSRDVLNTSLAQNAAQVAHAQAATAQAMAGVAEAAASRAQADAELDRARTLVGSGITSRESFDQRQAASQGAAARAASAEAVQGLAKADLQLALAQRAELLVRLARTEVRTPAAGVVSQRTARVGAVVGSAGEPLFRLVADGVVELRGEAPEADLVRLQPGQPASVHVPGRPGALPGRVRLVTPEVSSTTRLGQVRVALDGGGAGLPVGGFARATVVTAQAEGVLLPLSALLFGPEGARVQVVADGVVETRPVRLGLRDAGRAEVAAGVRAGETVVAVSGTFVRDGDRVTPIPASSPAPGQVAAAGR